MIIDWIIIIAKQKTNARQWKLKSAKFIFNSDILILLLKLQLKKQFVKTNFSVALDNFYIVINYS